MGAQLLGFLLFILTYASILGYKVFNYYYYADSIYNKHIEFRQISIDWKTKNSNIVDIISDILNNSSRWKVECYKTYNDFLQKRYYKLENYTSKNYFILINSNCSINGDDKTSDFLTENYDNIIQYFDDKTPIYTIGYVGTWAIIERIY